MEWCGAARTHLLHRRPRSPLMALRAPGIQDIRAQPALELTKQECLGAVLGRESPGHEAIPIWDRRLRLDLVLDGWLGEKMLQMQHVLVACEAHQPCITKAFLQRTHWQADHLFGVAGSVFCGHGVIQKACFRRSNIPDFAA